MQPTDSPCTKICTLHPSLQVCVGCGRNLAEIEAWPTLSSEQRIDMMEVVRHRLETLRDQNWQNLP